MGEQVHWTQQLSVGKWNINMFQIPATGNILSVLEGRLGLDLLLTPPSSTLSFGQWPYRSCAMGLTMIILQITKLGLREGAFLLYLLDLYGPRVALHHWKSLAPFCLLCAWSQALRTNVVERPVYTSSHSQGTFAHITVSQAVPPKQGGQFSPQLSPGSRAE